MKLLSLLSLSATALSLTTPNKARDTTSTLERRANHCGSNYEYMYVTALPEGTSWDSRKGALYVYGNGEGDGCLVLDNATGYSDQHMTVSVCGLDDDCDTDSGVFSSYAGPVYVKSYACADVSVKMGSDAYSTYVEYDSMYVFPCD